jgi:phage-related protein
MSQLEQANSQEQAGERAAAKREVSGLRGQWTTAQHELVAGAQREAEAKTSETLETVARERGAAEEQAAAHYEHGQQEAQNAKHEAEQRAASERQKAQGQNSGGLLGAIGSAAQSLFDKAKQAVQSVFDRARQLVRSAIERAQQLATAVMERARHAIVGAIRIAGTVLTAIGDRVLVAFPALRDRFRKAIQERIAAAEAAVNKLANMLKHAVQTALKLLGAALSAAIGLLHHGMQAAIDGVRAVVHGALDFARGAMAAFGNFAGLVKDIAANPGRWVSNLAAAVKDGIQNYLWVEIKTAVQGWFHDKVQEVVGVGEAIWHLLQRGGISIAEVARMAWEGLKAAIPGVLIALLIEKLMSLIVPAVGAILTIIQAIQAGWASLGRILHAFEAFFSFLKHVKLGSAGPLFAKAVAAGAIAAVEFVSNFLLTRLKSAASSVSNRLRALARRIGERLRAIGGRIVSGVKAVGSGLRRAGQKARAGFDRLRGKRPKSHADQERAKHERQEAAFISTKSHLDALFAKGVTRARLASEVAWLKLRYRWSSLRVQGPTDAPHAAVSGGFSPEQYVTSGRLRSPESLEALIGEDLIAQMKLRFVRKDPFISAALKADFAQRVEARLREAKSRRVTISPYAVMKAVVAGSIDEYRLLGTPITPDQIRKMGGLSRLISLTHVWDNYLPEEYQVDFGLRDVWLAAIRKNHSLFIPRVHLRSDIEISGSNDVGFWYARYRSAGATTANYVKRLQLAPARYPLGALKFELRSVPSHAQFRRPTAFDGMPHAEWAPPLRRDAVWGIVPGELPKIREAVAGPVPISAISSFEVILP